MGTNLGVMGEFYEDCVCSLLHIVSMNLTLFTLCRVKGVAEMTAIGLGLQGEAFLDASRYGYVKSNTLARSCCQPFW